MNGYLPAVEEINVYFFSLKAIYDAASIRHLLLHVFCSPVFDEFKEGES